jgi:HPt (histidine-containing phosphotransfer) domain-containing protein
MTAHAMVGDRERCLAAGMDGYVSKPVPAQLLFEAVEANASTLGTVSGGDTMTFNRADLLERLSGDEDLLADVVTMFLEDCPVRVAALHLAAEARDAGRLQTEAHALKGAAANLSAYGVSNAAGALERIGAERRLDEATAAWQLLSLEADRLRDVLERSSVCEA